MASDSSVKKNVYEFIKIIGSPQRLPELCGTIVGTLEIFLCNFLQFSNILDVSHQNIPQTKQMEKISNQIPVARTYSKLE